MLEQLKALAKQLIRTAEPTDPTVFDDPLAERTEWTPAAKGGTNIGTHALKHVNPQKIVFSATWGARLFTGIFILVGFAVPSAAGVSYVQGGAGMDPVGLGVTILFGAVFALAGLFARSKMCSPRTFDQRLGSFWKGRRMPAEVGSQQVTDDHVPLKEIHAVQLLKEYISSDNGGYYSYELNLVLKDASRVNVVDHGKIARLRRDAAEVAGLLGVSVWDASQ